MADTRVLVAYAEEYRAYRQAIAAGFGLPRPRAGVRSVGTYGLGAELKRFDPHLVVCGVPGRPNPVSTPEWVELSPEVDKAARVRAGDSRWEAAGLRGSLAGCGHAGVLVALGPGDTAPGDIVRRSRAPSGISCPPWAGP